MGLLDWLTDGSLGNMGMGAGGANPPVPDMPPVQQTGSDGPPLPPTPAAVPPGLDAAPTPSGQPPAPVAPPPDPTPAAGPPDPPVNPATSDIGGGMQGGGPTPPPVPMPQPRPPGADAAPPAPPASPGPPMPLTPSSLPPPGNGTNGVGPGLGVAAPPYKLGDQTALGRALGIDPKSQAFGTTMAGLGSGLTAAGNSKGKSPFQALTSGAGATLEGGAKEEHAANKDAVAYLNAAVSAKKAGDDAAYKTNYTAYLAAKLKSEQDAAASKDKAVANKNDSPTQLYLSAQRNVAADPLVKGAMTAYQAAIKDGDPTKVATAKSAYEQTVQERQAAHLAGVGLHPQTAADIAKQPGMSKANPVDAGTAGITPQNIGQKLQPGQYYTNPADKGTPKQGTVYIYQGDADKSTSSKSSTPSSKSEPADPMKKEKATTADAEDDD